MNAADLHAKATEYELRAASYSERAELEPAVGHERTALAFAIVALIFRELAACEDEQEAA